MTAPVNGRWVFSIPITGQPVVLGINNGSAPVFPPAQQGAFNIEVFTNIAVGGVPSPDPGFQSSIVDPGGTLDNGYLTGTNLVLGAGDFLAVDSVIGGQNVQSMSKITLSSGRQTVAGARGDTLIGGSGDQILLAAFNGGLTIIGGTGNESIWGGTTPEYGGNSIVGGSGANQQIVTGGGSTVVAGMGGSATITGGEPHRIYFYPNFTVTALPGSSQNIVMGSWGQDSIDLTGNTGVDAIINRWRTSGANGDTITAGSGTTNIDGSGGAMLIKIGAAGITNVSGSSTPLPSSSLTPTVPGNTILGGAGDLDFKPATVAGTGGLIDLSGSTGNATVNAFSNQGNRIVAPDTILAGNSADSVFGGAGDRIGTGNGSVVGGLHQWVHADLVAGSAVGFGSNDTVASTTYDTVAGIATRGTVAGSSSAFVTVGGFNPTPDFLFYQNENADTTNVIIATSLAMTVAGVPSSIITLPDGTIMTLVGLTQAQLTPVLFEP